MAGFASGFGSAFAQSFSQARDTSARRQDEMFKMKYQDFISRRDQIAETDKTNAKNVQLAKMIVKRTGQPEEAWTEAYNYLSAGSSEASVVKMFEENKAVVSKKTAAPNDPGTPADPRDDLTGAAASTVDSQMAASGMAPAKPGQGLFSGLGKTLGIGGSREEKVNQRLAQATSSDPMSVQNTLNKPINELTAPVPGLEDHEIKWEPKGSSPDPSKVTSYGEATAYARWAQTYGSPQEKEYAIQLLKDFQTQAQEKALFDRETAVKAQGNYIDETRGYLPDGSVVYKDANGQFPEGAKPYTASMEKEIGKIQDIFLPEIEKYQQAVTNYADMTRTADSLVQLASEMPEAAGRPGDFAQMANSALRYIQGVATVLTGEDFVYRDEKGRMTVDGEKGYQATLNAEAELSALRLEGRIDAAAVQAALIDITATKLAYQYAATLGQTGRAVSQEEFKNFKAAALGGGKPSAIAKGASNMITSAGKVIDDTARGFSRHVKVKGFEDRYQGVKFPGNIVDPLDAYLDDDTKAARDRVIKGDYTKAKQLPGIKTLNADPKLATQEYNDLPPGAEYIDPKGVKRRKGGQ